MLEYFFLGSEKIEAGQLIIASRCDYTMRRAHAADKYIKKAKKRTRRICHSFRSLAPRRVLSLIRAFRRSLNLRRLLSY